MTHEYSCYLHKFTEYLDKDDSLWSDMESFCEQLFADVRRDGINKKDVIERIGSAIKN